MAVVVGLLLGAAASMFGAPLLLRRSGWQTRYPRLALGLWCAAFLTGLGAAAMSLVWALGTVLVAHPGRSGPGLHPLAFAVMLFSWSGLAAAGGLVSLVASRAEPLSQEHRRLVALYRLLVNSCAYRVQRVGSTSVVFVASEVPVAASLPGRHHQIVLTSRMEDELTPGQVRAVIEHERAHLVGGHAWITQVARLNAACLPRLQGAREFQSAVRLLVELIADDAAARVCGRAEVAGALAALGSVRQDEGLMLRSRRVAARTGGGGLRRRIRGLGSASHPVPWAR